MKQFVHNWYLPCCQCTGHVMSSSYKIILHIDLWYMALIEGILSSLHSFRLSKAYSTDAQFLGTSWWPFHPFDTNSLQIVLDYITMTTTLDADDRRSLLQDFYHNHPQIMHTASDFARVSDLMMHNMEDMLKWWVPVLCVDWEPTCLGLKKKADILRFVCGGPMDDQSPLSGP